MAAFHARTVGGEVACTFEGQIRQSASTFGLPKPFGPLSGRIVYETSKPADYPLIGDALGYRQQRPAGLYADFGDIEVRADDYLMEVFNDLPQGASGVADVVTFAFASDFNPPLTAPLVVDGVPQPGGQFLLSFLWFGGQKFEHPAIEEVGALSGYDIAIALLGDSGRNQSADVFADQITVTEITALTADFNHDLTVNGTDFLIWQRDLGAATVQADADQDGEVTALDLQQWRTQWGLRSAPSAVPVPEFSSGLAFFQALLCLAFNGRRAR